MKNEYPSMESRLIRGEYADIVFGEESSLREYLDTANIHTTLYKNNDRELHYPLQSASLDFMRQGADDIDLYSSLDFDSHAIHGYQFETNWQDALGDKIRAILIETDTEMHRLKHEWFDFYIRLDFVHVVHIQFHTDTHDCSITMKLERASDLINASNGDIVFEPDPDDSEMPEHYEVLHKFASLWTVVMDVIVSELGVPEQDDTPRPQIVITSPVDLVSNEVDSASSALPPPDIETFASPEHGFNTIGGLTKPKQRLQEIADIFKDPLSASLYGVQPSHFLLHGPPGTGKTSLVQAFAHEVEGVLISVSTTDIVDKYVGNSGKQLKKVFTDAKKQAQSSRVIVFFDEFDAIAAQSHHGTTERVDVRKQLNKAIDDVSANHPNIVIAAATNASIEKLDASLVRSQRIEPISVPLPDESERADVWAAILTESMLSFDISRETEFNGSKHSSPSFIPYEDDIDTMKLATLTDGMTGSDFKTILGRARMKHFQHYHRTHEYGRVSQADLLREIENFSR